jgi:hypothetical protein
MSELLRRVRDLIQRDVNSRGLAADPVDNLLTACPDDFENAARSLAAPSTQKVGILTGFFIARATPPCGETDGPLGAVFLARALAALEVPCVLYADHFCAKALEVGLATAGVADLTHVVIVPAGLTAEEARKQLDQDRLSHLIAVERVGPCHTLESLRGQPGTEAAACSQFEEELPAPERDRLYNMRGIDITHWMAPGHLLVEAAGRAAAGPTTIGIGDGGNEIGMGKVPWRIIQKNVAKGGRIACRIRTDFLIVAGISNWGAYGLGFAASVLRGRQDLDRLLCVETERKILETMVERGPLVDGVTGTQTISVDGLPFEAYARPLREFQVLASEKS